VVASELGWRRRYGSPSFLLVSAYLRVEPQTAKMAGCLRLRIDPYNTLDQSLTTVDRQGVVYACFRSGAVVYIRGLICELFD